MPASSERRVVLFGATGFTGALTAAALARRGGPLVVAGRDPARLERLADDLRGAHPASVVTTAAADATDAGAVRTLLSPGDVLVTTVGPFARLGMPAARAAVDAGATYLDSTGEPAFLARLLRELDGPARDRGATLLPAFGYDYVPGNLAGALALNASGRTPTRVRVGYFVRGGEGPMTSGGTKASGAGMLLEPGLEWRGGRLVSGRIAARVATFDLGEGRPRGGVSVAGSEHLFLPAAYPGLRDVDVIVGWVGRRTREAQAGAALLHAGTRLPPVRKLVAMALARGVPGSSGGPPERNRAAARSVCVGEAFDAGGTRVGRVVLEGPSPYDLTADLLAWGATSARDVGLDATGVVGPVQAYGLDRLVAGAAEIGLTQV